MTKKLVDICGGIGDKLEIANEMRNYILRNPKEFKVVAKRIYDKHNLGKYRFTIFMDYETFTGGR